MTRASPGRPDRGGGLGLAGAALAVLARPGLWATAVRQLLLLAPRGWWRRPPFLPLPDRNYLAFRLQTMYGDPHHHPSPCDVVTYLDWCRTLPRPAGRGR